MKIKFGLLNLVFYIFLVEVLMETLSKHTVGEVLMKFDFFINDFNQNFGFGRIFWVAKMSVHF